MRDKTLPSKATKDSKQNDLSSYLKKAYSKEKIAKEPHHDKHHHASPYNSVVDSSPHGQIGRPNIPFHRTTFFK